MLCKSNDWFVCGGNHSRIPETIEIRWDIAENGTREIIIAHAYNTLQSVSVYLVHTHQSQLTFTSSKSTMETPEQCVTFVQS